MWLLVFRVVQTETFPLGFFHLFGGLDTKAGSGRKVPGLVESSGYGGCGHRPAVFSLAVKDARHMMGHPKCLIWGLPAPRRRRLMQNP